MLRRRWFEALVVSALVWAMAPGAAAEGAPRIHTLAGGVPSGVPATSISLTASALDHDDAGNLFVADPAAGLIWKITPDGIAHHVAGTGTTCLPFGDTCSNEGGLATQAFLHDPSGIVVADDGDVYVSEQRARVVRHIDAATGRIHTVAGNGELDYDAGAEGGPGTEFAIGYPSSLDMDSRGNVYITSLSQKRIFLLRPDGTIRTIAGCGDQSGGDFSCAFSAQDGSPVESTPIAPNATWNGSAFGIAVSPEDDLYISDAAQILRLDRATQSYRVVAGRSFQYAGAPGQGEGGPAIDARFSVTVDMDFDAEGNLYLMEGGGSEAQPWNRIQVIEGPVGPSSTLRHVGGTGIGNADSGDGGPATEARFAFSQPTNTWSGQGMTVSPAGDVYVGDYWNNRVRRVDAASGIVETFAGTGAGGIGDYATGIVHDMQPVNFWLWATGGFSGDGRPATTAQLHGPADVEVGPDGNVYVLDRYSFRVRRVAPDGTITTIAGSGCAGQTCRAVQEARPVGDGGPATEAALVGPTAIALDRTGTQLYILDRGATRVRQVNLGKSAFTAYPLSLDPVTIAPGHIDTVLGPGISARLPGVPFIANYTGCNIGKPHCGEGLPYDRYSMGDYVGGLTTDASGNLYLAETSVGQIVRVDSATGLVLAVAGTPHHSDCSGPAEDAPGRQALLCGPTGLAYGDGKLYVAETGWPGPVDSLANGFWDAMASRIRTIDLSTPAALTTTLAGTGVKGFAGDGGPATEANLALPHGLAVGPDGSVYVADTGNHRIRRIAPDGTISTVAGTGQWFGWYEYDGCDFSGDGGPATEATMCAPLAVDVASDGTVYVADQINNRIRVVEG